MGPPTLFTIPVLRYMKTYGTTEEQLAMVAVVQREWAAKNPRATFKDPVTVKDVLASRMIAYPFRLLLCCLVTDGGGALILTRADRAKDFPQKPVYLLGTGESVETPMVSQMEDFTSSRAFRVAGPKAFAEAGITVGDVDHMMIYDAFAHLPIYGLDDLGFVPRGEAGRFIAERNTAPGGKLPLNTNGGGPLLHAFRHVRHVRIAGERAPNARHRPRANPRCPDLGLPRRRRHVRRLRHDHHVARAAVAGRGREPVRLGWGEGRTSRSARRDWDPRRPRSIPVRCDRAPPGSPRRANNQSGFLGCSPQAVNLSRKGVGPIADLTPSPPQWCGRPTSNEPHSQVAVMQCNLSLTLLNSRLPIDRWCSWSLTLEKMKFGERH